MRDDDARTTALAAAPRRATAADPHDVAGLYVRHRSAFTVLARRHLRDERDVDEVVQEAFLRMFLALPELEDEMQAVAYGRRTITNLCIDRYRAQARRPSLVDLDSIAPEDAVEDDPGDPVVRAEDAAVVREALGMLSPLHRAALVKREIEEKPLPVIADELNVPEDSVKHLLYRARRALRRLLVGTSVAPGADGEGRQGVAARTGSRGLAALAVLLVLGLASGPDLESVPVVGVDLPDLLGVTDIVRAVDEVVTEVVETVSSAGGAAGLAAAGRSVGLSGDAGADGAGTATDLAAARSGARGTAQYGAAGTTPGLPAPAAAPGPRGALLDGQRADAGALDEPAPAARTQPLPPGAVQQGAGQSAAGQDASPGRGRSGDDRRGPQGGSAGAAAPGDQAGTTPGAGGAAGQGAPDQPLREERGTAGAPGRSPAGAPGRSTAAAGAGTAAGPAASAPGRRPQGRDSAGAARGQVPPPAAGAGPGRPAQAPVPLGPPGPPAVGPAQPLHAGADGRGLTRAAERRDGGAGGRAAAQAGAAAAAAAEAVEAVEAVAEAAEAALAPAPGGSTTPPADVPAPAP